MYVLPSYFRVKHYCWINFIRFGSVVLHQGKTLNYPSISISSNVDTVVNELGEERSEPEGKSLTNQSTFQLSTNSPCPNPLVCRHWFKALSLAIQLLPTSSDHTWMRGWSWEVYPDWIWLSLNKLRPGMSVTDRPCGSCKRSACKCTFLKPGLRLEKSENAALAFSCGWRWCHCPTHRPLAFDLLTS